MVMALMSGYSLTMGELAAEAGVTLSTASVHLAKLESSGIVVLENGIRCSKLRVRVVQSLAWAGRRIVGPS
jgi:DNA-binding transcriptional ArsR family regulator